MKKKVVSVVVAMLLCFSLFVGCDKGEGGVAKEVVFSEFSAVNIKLNQTEADLLGGATAKKGDDSVAITVDKSKVDFTKAGEYEITYTAESVVKTNKVYVFDMPKFFYKDVEIVGNAVNIAYKDALLNNQFKKNVKAKDSFNTELPVTFVESVAFDGKYGNFTAKYKATDKAGNEGAPAVVYTVITDGAPLISNATADFFLDLSKDTLGLKIAIGETEEVELYKGADKVNDAVGGDCDYNENKKELHIKSSYLKALGVGEHSFTAKTILGYTDFSITLTNDYPTYSTLSKPSSGTATLEIATTESGVNLDAGEKVWKYEINSNAEFNNRLEISAPAGSAYDLLNQKTVSFDFYAVSSALEHPFFYDNTQGGNVSKYYDILGKVSVGVSELVKEKWYTISVDLPTCWARPNPILGTVVFVPANNSQLTAYIKNITFTGITAKEELIYVNAPNTATIAKTTLETGVGEFPDLKEVYELTFGVESSEIANSFWIQSIPGSMYDLSTYDKIVFDVYIVGLTSETKFIYAGPPSDICGSRINKKTGEIIAGTGDMKGGTWYTFTVDLKVFTEKGDTYITTAGTAKKLYIANLQYVKNPSTPQA